MRKNKWVNEGITAEELFSKLRKKEQASLLFGNGFSSNNTLNKYGIPSFTMRYGSCGIVNEDGYKSLCFPSPSALASTWNKDLAIAMGKSIAKEAINSGVDVILAPSLNIKRNPLCGHNFELYSEDPILAGEIGGSFAFGIQSMGVGACLTDFVCHNQATSQAHLDAEVDQRALKELYLKAFEVAIDVADPWMVMTSYNKLNSIDCTANHDLLVKTLKGDMKFRGVVVSNLGSVTDSISNHNSGLDLEIPCSFSKVKDIVRALKKGELEEKRFEDSAKRVLTLALKTKERPRQIAVSDDEQYALMQEICEESIILAKNSFNILPLASYQDTCVIGSLAECFQIAGDSEFDVYPKTSNSLLNEISKHCAATNTQCHYAPGYSLRENLAETEIDRLIIDAEELASKSKRVIYVIGSLPGSISSKYDRSNMRLSKAQMNVFNHIYEHNKNIILVVVTGSPIELPMADCCKAVVICYFGGEMSAKALNRVLIGRVNPSGRLAETWPLSYSNVPSGCFYPISKVPSPYKESIYVGYRYYQSALEPTRFCFGHGLSYSRTVLKDFGINKNIMRSPDKVEVFTKVHNMSRRIVKETIQFYISGKGGNVFKPIRELKDFVKVTLHEEETKLVKTTLSFMDFAYYDIEEKKWQVEEGEYQILVGKSVDDVELAGTVYIKSGVFKIHKEDLPSYYYFTSKSLFIPSDHEFEELLQHRIKNRCLLESDVFSLESTLKHVSDTALGRKLIKELEERMDHSLSNGCRKAYMNNLLERPIRTFVKENAPKHSLIAGIDAANAKLFSAFFHYLWGHKK